MRCILMVASVLFAAPLAGQSAPQDKFFASNGVQIRYVEQGSGAPVILVPGYTQSLESNWMATAKRLAGTLYDGCRGGCAQGPHHRDRGSLDAALRGLQQLQTVLPAMKLVTIEGATDVGDRGAVRRPEFVKAVRELLSARAR
jgi:hypothetical protein